MSSPASSALGFFVLAMALFGWFGGCIGCLGGGVEVLGRARAAANGLLFRRWGDPPLISQALALLLAAAAHQKGRQNALLLRLVHT